MFITFRFYSQSQSKRNKFRLSGTRRAIYLQRFQTHTTHRRARSHRLASGRDRPLHNSTSLRDTGIWVCIRLSVATSSQPEAAPHAHHRRRHHWYHRWRQHSPRFHCTRALTLQISPLSTALPSARSAHRLISPSGRRRELGREATKARHRRLTLGWEVTVARRRRLELLRLALADQELVDPRADSRNLLLRRL